MKNPIKTAAQTGQEMCDSIRDQKLTEKSQLESLNNRLINIIEKNYSLLAQIKSNQHLINFLGNIPIRLRERTSSLYDVESKSMRVFLTENKDKLNNYNLKIKKFEKEYSDHLDRRNTSVKIIFNNRDKNKQMIFNLSKIEAQSIYYKRLINESEQQARRIIAENTDLKNKLKLLSKNIKQQRNDIDDFKKKVEEIKGKLKATENTNTTKLCQKITSFNFDEMTGNNTKKFHIDLIHSADKIRKTIQIAIEESRKQYEMWYREKKNEIQQKARPNVEEEKVIVLRKEYRDLTSQLSSSERKNQYFQDALEEIKKTIIEERNINSERLEARFNEERKLGEQQKKLLFDIEQIDINNLKNEIQTFKRIIEKSESGGPRAF